MPQLLSHVLRDEKCMNVPRYIRGVCSPVGWWCGVPVEYGVLNSIGCYLLYWASIRIFD